MRNHDAIVIGTGQSGPALALQDLVAGQIDLMFDNPITPLPYVRAGSIQSLAWIKKRSHSACSQIVSSP
jgi:tripartite-type tricarboxylate transporter receptor subunit TctC